MVYFEKAINHISQNIKSKPEHNTYPKPERLARSCNTILLWMPYNA